MLLPADREVLVVDDDHSARVLFATTFDVEGWRVRTASTGQEAIDELLVRTPDIVVVDLMMPGVAGFEVLQAMHAHPQLQRVPRIVCSARDSGEERSVAEALGAGAWLVKPVEPEDLVAAAERLLDPDADLDHG